MSSLKKHFEKILYSLLITGIVCFSLAFLPGCGDSPADLPSPVLNLGSLNISFSLQSSPEETLVPDSIGIVMDGNDLGMYPNPAELHGILAERHTITAYFRNDGRVISSQDQIVEVMFGEETDHAFNLMAGSISIFGEISISADDTVYPDSIAVILDGDSLGYVTNPDTIAYVPEGEHQLDLYCRYDEKDFIGTPQVVDVVFNTVSPAQIPMSSGGVVYVNAIYDDQPVAECGVLIDGNDFGVGVNPRIVPNIAEGIHKISIYSTIDTIYAEGWARDVAVALSETTFVDISVQHVSPFEGFHAPDFKCLDIDGNEHYLSDHWGKVVFLYFFEGT